MSRARLTLNGLNTDCLELIFSHLSTREIAAYVAPVSKEWRQIALNLTTKVFVYNEKATPYILKTPKRQADNLVKRCKIDDGLRCYLRLRQETLKTLIISVQTNLLITSSMSETACGCKTLTVLVIKASNAYTKESVPVTLPSKLELLRTDLNVEILTSDSSYYSKLKVLELPHFGCKQLGATSKLNMYRGLEVLMSTQAAFNDFDWKIGALAKLKLLSITLSMLSLPQNRFWDLIMSLENLEYLMLQNVESARLGNRLDRHPSLKALLLGIHTCSDVILNDILRSRHIRAVAVEYLISDGEVIIPRNDLSASNLCSLSIASGDPIRISLKKLLAAQKLQTLIIRDTPLSTISDAEPSAPSFEIPEPKPQVELEMIEKSDDEDCYLRNLGFEEGDLEDSSIWTLKREKLESDISDSESKGGLATRLIEHCIGDCVNNSEMWTKYMNVVYTLPRESLM